MKIEALKEKARRHEQKEEWQKALDLYKEALLQHDEDEQPDITLFNRVGDIQIRVGQVEGAIKSYETAIDLYMEAELPNNAIAICKKVLRNLPDRSNFFLRMGQIRGSQGFLTDARQNFLTYAERKTEEGDMDAALDALVEFVALAPEDLEIRMGLASQLESHDRMGEAVEQYADAYKHFILQDQEEEAEAVADKIRELAPDTVIPDAQSIRAGAEAGVEEGAFEFGSSLAGMELDAAVPIDDGPSALERAEAEYAMDYGEIDLDVGSEEEPEEEEVPEEAGVGAEAEADAVPTFGLEADELTVEEAEEAESLPTFGFQEEEEEEAEALPTFEFQEEEEEEAEALPTFEFQEEEEEEAEALPTFGFQEEEEEEAEALPTFGFQEEGAEADEGEALPSLDFREEEEGAEADEAEALPSLDFREEEEGAEAEEEAEEAGAGAFPTFEVHDEDRVEEEAEGAPSELELGLEGLSLGEAAEEAPQGIEEALLEEPSAEAPEEEAIVGTSVAAREEALVEASQEAREEAVEDASVESVHVQEPATHQEAAELGDLDLALNMVREEIAARPDEVGLHQRMVEYAFRSGDNQLLIDSYMQLARCLVRTEAPAKAKAIYQQVLSLAPGHGEAQQGLDELEGVSTTRKPTEVASSEEYVDLGSMILGGEQEKTTRWQVAADAPSGDEKADFARMLNQFKDKVSEHVDADDVTAHHDLGTAYMEMGLYEEAIGEFQMALRAAPGHLPTHEVMGRCWMEFDQPKMAARALQRALEVGFDVEDELIGIYYLMGRAQEDLGNPEGAVEFYEKVFSLDINFEDVTERLRALR